MVAMFELTMRLPKGLFSDVLTICSGVEDSSAITLQVTVTRMVSDVEVRGTGLLVDDALTKLKPANRLPVSLLVIVLKK